MRRLCLSVVLLSAILAIPVRAQEEKPIHLSFHGPEVFCHILFSKSLAPLETFADVADPKDTLIIIFGDPSGPAVKHFSRGGMTQFLADGGNLLIATDRAWTFPDLGVNVTGIRVNNQDKGPRYRGELRCPMLGYLEETPQGVRDVREHPIFQLLHRGIAANWPSHIGLSADEKSRESLLRFETKGTDRKNYIYMVGSPRDAPPLGRSLVIAGHGMFFNGMMLQSDNDNFAFAVNAVQWLRERENGQKRSRALFIVNGNIITDFNMNLEPPPPKLPMPTVSMLNRLIRGLEDEDFFHRVLQGLLGDRIKLVVAIMLAVATALLALYGGKKFLEGRYASDTAVPRMVGALAGSGIETKAAPRLEQQQQALFRQTDGSETARQLVLQWFSCELGIAPVRWLSIAQAEFRATGSIMTRVFLQGRADYVLRLAHSASPIKVAPADFAALVHALPELSRALEESRLALLLEGKEVRRRSEPEA